MDSRLTLAASRSVAERSLYFTYYSESHPVYSNDIAVARRLRDALGLQHRELRTTDFHAPADFAHEFALNTDGMQGSSSIAYLFAAGLGEGYVHVRSNVLETMRGFYLKNSLNHRDRFDAYKLARLFRQATADEFTPHFQAFVEKTSFKTEAFRGFHYTDMFYWEHRLGAWLGPMIRGQRAAQETYIIYNSRALLELMMSRPMEARLRADIVRSMIERLWPEALEVPVFSGARYTDWEPAAPASAPPPVSA
jgi:asparagine synthase (glutamine-hydrolysing)